MIEVVVEVQILLDTAEVQVPERGKAKALHIIEVSAQIKNRDMAQDAILASVQEEKEV